MAKSAHSLISSSGFVGAKRLTELFREFQRLGVTGSIEDAVSLLPMLIEEFEGVCKRLSAELSDGPAGGLNGRQATNHPAR
ncbi:MAG: hypothetical protein AB9873_03080 [Syntrophobacteraceae bacterium]